MRQSSTIYFALTKDFDYLEYLKERSHFEDLNESLSDQLQSSAGQQIDATHELRDSIGTLRIAAYEQSASLSRIEGELAQVNESLVGMHNKLFDIEDAILETNSLLDWGFTSVIAKMDGLNDNLEELLRLSQNPSQTWAYEQFDIARRALSKGFTKEAYRSVNMAISGYESHTGFEIEHRFHLLKGFLELGSPEAVDDEFISPQNAAESFSKAAKYAAAESAELASIALCREGWAHYCAGDEDKAYRCFAHALSNDIDNAEAHYNLARICFRRGDLDTGNFHLREAIQRNVMFADVLKDDEGMVEFSEQLQPLINSLRTEVRETIERVCGDATTTLARLKSTDIPAEATQAIAAIASPPPEALPFYEMLRARETYFRKMQSQLSSAANSVPLGVSSRAPNPPSSVDYNALIPYALGLAVFGFVAGWINQQVVWWNSGGGLDSAIRFAQGTAGVEQNPEGDYPIGVFTRPLQFLGLVGLGAAAYFKFKKFEQSRSEEERLARDAQESADRSKEHARVTRPLKSAASIFEKAHASLIRDSLGLHGGLKTTPT